MKTLAALTLVIALNTVAMNAQQTEAPTLGIGSTFLYRTATSPLNFPSPQNESYDSITVTRTNLTVGGKSDVIELFHHGNAVDYYSYLRFETNGDISESQIQSEPIGNHGDIDAWFTYPVGSKDATTTIEGDISYGGLFIETLQIYSGERLEMVEGAPHTVHMVIATHNVYENHTVQMQGMELHRYDPMIGYFTEKVESTAMGIKRSNLVAYTLKP